MGIMLSLVLFLTNVLNYCRRVTYSTKLIDSKVNQVCLVYGLLIDIFRKQGHVQ